MVLARSKRLFGLGCAGVGQVLVGGPEQFGYSAFFMSLDLKINMHQMDGDVHAPAHLPSAAALRCCCPPLLLPSALR